MKNCHFRQVLLVFVLLIGLVSPLRSASAADGGVLPEFPDFVRTVKDGQAKMVRGVYVPETLALRVVQQPEDDPGAVTRADGVATQFSQAALNHVIGLLAHNDLAGASFSKLQIGQEVRIIYGNGRVEYYLVNRLARYQALWPGSQNEEYIDLLSNITYSPQDIFKMFYDGDVHVTFQTCIFQNGDASWGRFFVTAIPVPLIYQRKFQASGFMFGLANPNVEIHLGALTWDWRLR